MPYPSRCRKCAMRLEEVNGRKVVLRRLLVWLEKHPESAKVPEKKAEILSIKEKNRRDMLEFDACECTVAKV